MTNNKENNKYSLKDKQSGELVRAKLTGEVFVYSNKQLAQQAKRSLENDRKISIQVVPA